MCITYRLTVANSGMGTVLGNPSDRRSHAASTEQREFTRHNIALAGQLFLPAEDASFDCQVLNISRGGAGVHCSEPPPLQSFVVLYMDGFGRFEGITNHYVDGELGLRFVCKKTKCQRLLNDIFVYLSNGTKASTDTRRHDRSTSVRWGHFVRPNGDNVRCEALDISAQGISVKTEVRPPIGELTKLGHIYGRVRRHHDEGVAIQFLEPIDRPFDVC